MVRRAVQRGHQRKRTKPLRRIGVDEKAAAKGHRYLTLVCDLEAGTVEHIAEDRKQESFSPEPLSVPVGRALRRWRWTCGSPSPGHTGLGARGGEQDCL